MYERPELPSHGYSFPVAHNVGMNIEQKAVGKVNDAILDCDHLEPYIASIDRVPLTDGHIDIHSSEEHTKTTFIGRVSVQVKGKTVKNLDLYNKTFPVERADLEGYHKDGGVLYFVVFMGVRGQSPKVHYKVLTPYGIDELLRSMKPGQKTKTITLRKLPADPDRIEKILNVALRAKREVPGSQLDAGLLERITELKLHTDGNIPFDEPVTLDRANQDFTLEFRTAGGMTGNLDGQFELVPEPYIKRQVNVPVTCGDYTFETPSRRRVSKELTELELSPGLKLTVPETGEREAVGSVSFTTQRYLENRYKDLGFFMECTSGREILFGETPTKIQINQPLDDQAELESHFRFLTELRELIIGIHGNPELIDLDALDQRRTQQLERLKPMIMEGLEEKQDFDRPMRLRQPVGEWNIELIFLEGKEQGEWRCVDLFSKELHPCFFKHDLEAPEDEPVAVRVTPYDILDTEELGKCLNLNLELIVGAYDPFAIYPESRSEANLTVLKLIHAADKYECRKSEFLDAATRLNEWLIENEGEEPLHLINQLQLKYRILDLDEEDRKKLRAIKREASRKTMSPTSTIEVACAILMQDFDEVLECFELLNDEAQESMKTWPIWNLVPAEHLESAPDKAR